MNRLKSAIIFLPLLLILPLFFIFSPAKSFAATIYVATTGSDTTGIGTQANPYKTITKALTQGSAGDTISIAAGTYNADETFPLAPKDDMTIEGAGSSTLIRGDGANSVIAFDGVTGVTVKDLKVDGYGYGDSYVDSQGSSSNTTFSDLIVYNSLSSMNGSSGIAVSCNTGAATIKNCIVYNTDGGFVAYAMGSSGTVNIYNCVAYNCSGTTWGGRGFCSVSAVNDKSPTMNVKNSIAMSCTIGIGGLQYLPASGTGSHTVTSDYNLFYSNTTNIGTVPVGTLTQLGHDLSTSLNPYFIDAANHNFHL